MASAPLVFEDIEQIESLAIDEFVNDDSADDRVHNTGRMSDGWTLIDVETHYRRLSGQCSELSDNNGGSFTVCHRDLRVGQAILRVHVIFLEGENGVLDVRFFVLGMV